MALYHMLVSTATIVVTFVSFLNSPILVIDASQNMQSHFDIAPKTTDELHHHKKFNKLRKSTTSEGFMANTSMKRKSNPRAPQTTDEIERFEVERANRIKSRREKARAKISSIRPEPGSLHQISKEEMSNIYDSAKKNDPGMGKEEHQWIRRMGWGSGNSDYNPYEHEFLASSGGEYDWWAQGYRMLGGFIDCDHSKSNGSHDSGENKNDGSGGCSRWMMWAAYVNPNYQGGGRDEYFEYGDYDFYKDDEVITDEPSGSLDCHSADTEWILLGVYRQEFYQFIEQISKHLWAIDEYEYVVALAGLAYMTDYDCWQISGGDDDGDVIYAGVQPLSEGKFQMSLYADSECLYPTEFDGLNYDSFGMASDMELSSQDVDFGDDDALYSQLYGYWTESQEYTLSLLNEVYEEYKYCTLCMDYPTYQDGYFIGDYGTDDDDIINQCWKFHSHDSYPCESDCIAMGSEQGTIVQIKYGDKYYGTEWDGVGFYGGSTHYDHYKQGYTTDTNNSKLEKLKANAFLTFSGILFIATFLAFAVARGTRRSNKGDKSRALLTDEEKDRARSREKSTERSRTRSKSKSRSQSKVRSSNRSSSRKRRGEESGHDDERRDRSGRSSRKSKSRSKSQSRRKHEDGDGERREKRRSKSKTRSSSRHTERKDPDWDY